MWLRHKTILNIWLALTLCILFFHPIFATLHDDNIILQWRFQDSMELISVIALLILLLTGTLWLIDRISDAKTRFFIVFLTFIIPFTSFLVHFLQQLGFKDNLVTFGQYLDENHLLVAIMGVFCAAILMLGIRYPRKMTYAIVMILFALSPLNLLAIWTLWDLKNINTKIVINTSDPYLGKKQVPKHNLIVILFDEMSYDYLYKNSSIGHNYVNFQTLSNISDNYHTAISPGKKTLTSIPGMLMGQHYDNIIMKYGSLYSITKDNKEECLKTEPDNLFAIAKNRGYKTLAYGPALPYCILFDQYLDVCHSFGGYNSAEVETHFSLLHPIITTFLLWPHQKPQGFIKIPIALLYQREQTEQIFHLILKTLDEKTPIFLFSHLLLPHQPFMFDRNGYYDNKEPFLESSENYLKQLEYVDYLLGKIMLKMKNNGIFESSEIIVLSDHNFRTMFPGKETHIPLIVKHPHQRTKKDIFNPTHVEKLLKTVVSQAGGT